MELGCRYNFEYKLREKKKTAYELYIELRKTNTITRLGIRKFSRDKSSIFTCFLRIKLGNKYAAICVWNADINVANPFDVVVGI